MALTVTVDAPPRDREMLESWTRSAAMRAGLARRARIVLLAADEVPVKDIAERVGVSKQTVIAWKKRYLADGVGGLEDRPKPGRPAVVDEAEVVAATWTRRQNGSGSLTGPRACWPASWASATWR